MEPGLFLLRWHLYGSAGSRKATDYKCEGTDRGDMITAVSQELRHPELRIAFCIFLFSGEE